MAKKYTAEERAEAVKLAREIGNRAAAERLDINIDTLYNWYPSATPIWTLYAGSS